MPRLLLLTSLGCTPCLRVKRILNELQAEFPDLSVEEVEYTSDAGSKLAIDNNIAYPPAVFLDGKFLAKGKIYAEQIAAAVQAYAVFVSKTKIGEQLRERPARSGG